MTKTRRYAMQIKDTYNQVIKYLGIKKLKKYRLRSPTFFVNLQIVFGCLEKVGVYCLCRPRSARTCSLLRCWAPMEAARARARVVLPVAGRP